MHMAVQSGKIFKIGFPLQRDHMNLISVCFRDSLRSLLKHPLKLSGKPIFLTSHDDNTLKTFLK